MECKGIGYYRNIFFILIISVTRFLISSCKYSGNIIDCSCLNLTTLTLDNNEECNETRLTGGVVLNFSHNLISSTEGIIPHIENFKIIDLSYNNIEEFLGFSQSHPYSEIVSLFLSHNSIKSLKESDLQSLSSLEILDLSHNCISFIEKGTFSYVFRLERLDLSWNILTTLTMECPEAIEYLNFNNNQLHKLDLTGMCNFKELYIGANNFSSCFERQDNWKGKIFIGGNPEAGEDLFTLEDVKGRIKCGILVPPRVLLLHNGSTLVNATYDRERANYIGIYAGKETYVEEGSQVNVTCLAEGAKPEATLTWTKNEYPIDTIVYTLSDYNQQENRTNDTTSVLQFNANEENITIICNSSLHGTDITTLVSATFKTYVKPTVFCLLNGKSTQDSNYVPENEYVNITCYAKGARPVADLILEGYNQRMESNASRLSAIDSGTFDSSSTLVFYAKYDKATVSCTIKIPEINHSDTVSFEIKTFVLSKPVLTVNGGRFNEVTLDQDETVNIICNASTARPKPKLTLTRNGRTLHDIKSDNSGSSVVIFVLDFLPKPDEVVMCLSFLDQVNITEMANVTFRYQPETSSELNLNMPVLVPSATAAVVLLLILIIYFIARRRNGDKSTDLSALQLALRERPVDGLTHNSRELPAIRQPMSPDEDDTEINYDEVKTSTLSDVQMLIQLPGEGTFQYWTANASFENESSKKIIVKCLSEKCQLKEHFNLKTLAENVKTLKSHRNVVEILGVSITNVPYYIYLEYLEYGTLRDFLLRNYQQSRNSQCNITQTLDERAIQLTGFALDVADGLIYLTDRDYCHPALCTRKILLTKIGTCKLYDFWPKQLSAERINQILAKSVPPVAWLSPETIFLNNYFDKSDVWTYGVTLWEIYSLGETPYSGLTCDEIEQEIRKMRYLDQPLTCPGGLFSMMLASWDKTVDKRPDLSEWKQKLVCLLQTAKEDFGDKSNTGDDGDKSYFTLENNICDYEDDYIEQ